MNLKIFMNFIRSFKKKKDYKEKRIFPGEVVSDIIYTNRYQNFPDEFIRDLSSIVILIQVSNHIDNIESIKETDLHHNVFIDLVRTSNMNYIEKNDYKEKMVYKYILLSGNIKEYEDLMWLYIYSPDRKGYFYKNYDIHKNIFLSSIKNTIKFLPSIGFKDVMDINEFAYENNFNYDNMVELDPRKDLITTIKRGPTLGVDIIEFDKLNIKDLPDVFSMLDILLISKCISFISPEVNDYGCTLVDDISNFSYSYHSTEYEFVIIRIGIVNLICILLNKGYHSIVNMIHNEEYFRYSSGSISIVDIIKSFINIENCETISENEDYDIRENDYENDNSLIDLSDYYSDIDEIL